MTFSMAAPSVESKQSLGVLWVAFIGTLLSAGLVFTVEFPPIQDYPNHLLRHLIIEEAETEPYSEYIAIDPSFRPNMMADLLLLSLRPLMDLESAG